MRYIVYTLVLLGCFSLRGQTGNSTPWYKNITLRQSFDSKTDKAKPANITYTNPDDGDESWLVNIALGYDLTPDSEEIIIINPYIEYHRNSLVDKEQYNWETGVFAEWQTQDIFTKKWSPVLIGAVRYNDDRIGGVQSLMSNLYFTPLFRGKGMKPEFFWLPNTAVKLGKAFRFIYTPYLGLETENRIQTDNSDASGSIYRGYFSISSTVVFFPDHEVLKDRLEIDLDWQYRYILGENVAAITQDDYRYFNISFNYILYRASDGKRIVKLGIDYTTGENPAKNFQDQTFYALSLKVRL